MRNNTLGESAIQARASMLGSSYKEIITNNGAKGAHSLSRD